MVTCTTAQDFEHDRYCSLVITWSCKRRGQFEVAGEAACAQVQIEGAGA